MLLVKVKANPTAEQMKEIRDVLLKQKEEGLILYQEDLFDIELIRDCECDVEVELLDEKGA